MSKLMTGLVNLMFQWQHRHLLHTSMEMQRHALFVNSTMYFDTADRGVHLKAKCRSHGKHGER